MRRFPGDEVVQQYDDPAQHQVLIRLQQAGTSEAGQGLEQTSKQVEEALQKAGLPKFTIVARDLVGPTVGEDLQRRGIYAVARCRWPRSRSTSASASASRSPSARLRPRSTTSS